jgi:hypothetical protein
MWLVWGLGVEADKATLHFAAERRAGKTTLARALGLPAVVFCEEEWQVTLGFEVRSLAEFEAAAVNRRALIGPLCTTSSRRSARRPASAMRITFNL